VKARYVFENVNFQRGVDPLGAMGLGGLSFDTLQPGAILRSKKSFGVTKSTGVIGGYHSSALSIAKMDWLLVTDVRDQGDGKKNISWKRYHHSSETKVYDQREKFKESGSKGLEWYGVRAGFFDNITKRKFDYRLDIIEPGFPVNESINFERGQDPKRAMRIGERTWNKLRPGDILIPKKESKIVRDKFKPPSYKGGMTLYPQDYVVIYKIRRAAVWSNSFMRNGYAIGLHKCWDLPEAMKVRKIIEDGLYEEPKSYLRGPVEATDQQWENRFDIYEG